MNEGLTSEEELGEEGDKEVPTDLLELHILLEEAGVTPEEFKEAFGNELGEES